MARIACLLVPDLAVAAVCRADPDLPGRPLVLTDAPGAHARVVGASVEARALGVRAGRHTVAQARAYARDLTVRQRDGAAESSARRALVDVAASLADRIEQAPDGAVFLDADGSTHLVGSEAGLATALVARAARVGLTARSAVASSMVVARLAAHHGHGTEVVPTGAARGFLAALPLGCLAPPPDVAATLARWGIRTLGELAQLPAGEIATRLGADGAALIRAARGDDERPLAPQSFAHAVEESIALEYAIDTVEPLLFVLNGLVLRAIERLGLSGTGTTDVGLALDLDDRSRDARTIPLVAPTRDVKTLLTCLRVDVEARPPRAAIVRVVLTLVPARVRATQLGLFTPAGPAPERLATTLARLGALCGTGRVGVPVAMDSHRPGDAGVAPFVLDTVAATPNGEGATACRLVIRALRPPRPLEVFTERDAPSFVRGSGLGGRVVGVAGPWRVATEWWSDAVCLRDYYDLELTDGGIYRCFRDRRSGAWFVDGAYD
jgi:protein ImuB